MKVLENDQVKYWMEDGILFSEFKKETDLTTENLMRIIGLRHQISGVEKQYWCINAENIKSFPKDAQEYAEVYGQDYLYASAVIVKSHLSRFFFNSFTHLRKVKVPLRMFKSKGKALAWLKEFKKGVKEL